MLYMESVDTIDNSVSWEKVKWMEIGISLNKASGEGGHYVGAWQIAVSSVQSTLFPLKYIFMKI